MMPSRVVRITDLLQCALVTKRIKTAVILQLVKLGYMFRPLPGHHEANKETEEKNYDHTVKRNPVYNGYGT